jgi:anti-anti-sigma factor
MRAEPMHLTVPIDIHFFRRATLVRLHGELSYGNPHDVTALAAGLAAPHKPVVLNVSQVSYFDVGGLKWLMKLTERVRAQGDPLILESPTSGVDQILALTGCQAWFSAATGPGPSGRRDTAWLIGTLSA